jgi:hypothetical protein
MGEKAEVQIGGYLAVGPFGPVGVPNEQATITRGGVSRPAEFPAATLGEILDVINEKASRSAGGATYVIYELREVGGIEVLPPEIRRW